MFWRFKILLTCLTMGFALSTLSFGQTSQDSDGDGLSDDIESQIGTLPNNPDTDGDGLWDGWEYHKGVFTIASPIKLEGADPLRKDIYVEVDRFRSVASTPQELELIKKKLQQVVDAFGRKKTNDPKGINLHIEYDQVLNDEPNISVNSFEVPGIRWPRMLNEVFKAEKQLTHHHALLALKIDIPLWPSQTDGLHSSSNFVIDARYLKASSNHDEVTFMHELGNTLGLTHGGIAVDSNPLDWNPYLRYRPNHISVMNYGFRSGLIKGPSGMEVTFLDFQDFEMPAVDENILDEPLGFRLPPVHPAVVENFKTFPSRDRFAERVYFNSPIDWNLDGDFVDLKVSVDIDGDYLKRSSYGTVNEWEHLNFQTGLIGSRYLFAALGKPETSNGSTNAYSIIDEKSFARDPNNGFASTGEVIPFGLFVDEVETQTLNGNTYSKINENLTSGGSNKPRTWWTAKSNLGSRKEFDRTLFPATPIDTSTLSGIDRSMASLFNTKGRFIAEEANRLGLAPSSLAAVLFVESGGRGFDAIGNPIIRFENHKFYEFWGQRPANARTYANHFRYDSTKPWLGHEFRSGLLDPWMPCHSNQAFENKVMQFARSLDRPDSTNDISAEEAAFRSISVGTAQIMGFNHSILGFMTAKELFEDFSVGIRNQLVGFILFIEKNGKCLDKLKAKDYVGFAKIYNGPGQAADYGKRIENAANVYDRIIR